MADAQRDDHPEPQPGSDEDRAVERDAVDDARAVDAVVRHPDHDDTTQREAVENALQDTGLSEAGEEIGDEMGDEIGDETGDPGQS